MSAVSKSSTKRTFSFSVSINSVDKFKTLVKEINNASITFLITTDSVNLIHADSGFYLCKTLDVLDMDELESPIALRIKKDDFMNLLSEGIIKFTLDYITNKITLTYLDVKGNFLYKYTLSYQQDLISNYLENLNAFFNYFEYPKFSIENIGTILRVAKTLQEPLKCDGETLCVDTGNVFVYQKFKSIPFNVNSKLLYLLKTFSNEIYSVKEYFVVGLPDLIIAVNKFKVAGKHDFDYAINSKSSYIVKFTLDNVLSLAKKVKLNSGKFVLNFKTHEATFKSNDSEYTTNLKVIDSKSASSNLTFRDLSDPNKKVKVVEPPAVLLPGSLFKGVFGNLSSKTQFVLYLKKNFVLICAANLYIVVGKSLVG